MHSEDLVGFVRAVSLGLPPPPSYPAELLGSDTYVNPHTFTAARLAAGGAAEVASAVASGRAAHGAGTTRSQTWPWASAFSTTPRWQRVRHKQLAHGVCSSWIGTFTTATARRLVPLLLLLSQCCACLDAHLPVLTARCVKCATQRWPASPYSHPHLLAGAVHTPPLALRSTSLRTTHPCCTCPSTDTTGVQ